MLIKVFDKEPKNPLLITTVNRGRDKMENQNTPTFSITSRTPKTNQIKLAPVHD